MPLSSGVNNSRRFRTWYGTCSSGVAHFRVRKEMLMKRVLVASVFALSGVYGLSAQAQPPYPAQQPYPAQPSYQAQPPYQAPPTGEVSQPYFEKIVPAPSQAFEINGTVAYTQPWGNLTDNLTAQ